MTKLLQILDIASTSVDTNLFNITAINRRHDPYWLEFSETDLNRAGVTAAVLPLTSIDRNKKWLINLDILNHMWYQHDGDIFESFDPEILKELQHGNAYLILNHQCESFTHSFFKILYKKLREYPVIPFNKIIYMVASIDAQREYDKFADEFSISVNDRIEIMYVHHVYKRFHHDTDLTFFDYDRTVKKEKKFLSLNRRWRKHRLLMVAALSDKDLIKDGFVSLGVEEENRESAYLTVVQYCKDRMLDDNLVTGFEKIKDQLPLHADPVDLSINHFGHNTLPIEYYQKSCFSLVSSTNGIQSLEPSAGFTEKEIKPILARHPFIIHNNPGVLKAMRDMGFLTFGRWFDESYDNEQNDIKRLEIIVNEVKRLSDLSFEEWEVMLDEMEPILNHNYNRLVNYTNEHCFFNSDLKNLLYYAN